MKKFSLSRLFVVISFVIAMAMMGSGAARENTALLIAGLGLGFAAIIIFNLVTSIIRVNRSYSPGGAAHRRTRAAQYMKAFSAFVISLGMIAVFVGIFMSYAGVAWFLYIAAALLAVGFGLSIAGSVMLKAASDIQPVKPDELPRVRVYGSDPVIRRILGNPYVLLDERIRRIPEVQNLLQYPEVQRIFFEPARLCELSENENVRRLLDIVGGWLTQNNAEEIFAAAEQRRPVNTPAVRQNKTAQTNSSKIARAAVVILFAAVWLTVFAVIAFKAKTSS